ncbi:glycosyl hydrolase [uncultured Bacteroides sp.]|uniref:glycosyl hydrolase n=1 Tax=uncultured Bacteroides sp. TaxID=162156 RepID=UPI002AAC42CF|nr:glycosyl hydrolase [uncultured Bacteroides sp.]
MRISTSICLIAIILLLGITLDAQAQKRSEKRGIAQNGFTYPEEITALVPGVSWYYNWGTAPSSIEDKVVGPGTSMDFVPMAWNGNFDEQKLRDYLSSHPGVKYILGFNEPNFKKQANMTPEQAVEIWPKLERIATDFNLEIVGPALNYSPDAPYKDPITWYDEFFKLAPNARVDYLALHCYMVTSYALTNFIDKIANRYNKRIWLTEFCAWDNLTYDQTAPTVQRDEMVRKVEALELNTAVVKYSWFKAKSGDAYPYYALLKYKNDAAGIPVGTLTDLGEIYVNMSSFDTGYYYDTNSKIPATNYIKSEYITVELNTDPDSPFKLQLGSFSAARSVNYLVNVPSASTYQLSIRMASVENLFNPDFEIYSNGIKVAEQEIPATGGTDIWETKVINVALPAGKQTISIKSINNTTCKISWINVSSLLSNINNTSLENPGVSLYQYENALSVQVKAEIANIEIYDLSGKKIKEVSEQNKIDVSSLCKGIYLIKISLANGTPIIKKYIVK